MRNRLHAICPYFAMFPESFAEEQIKLHTRTGDWVLDPFSGRGTTLLQSLLMGRRAAAIDTNPVAYCISSAKAHVPALEALLDGIADLRSRFSETDRAGLRQTRLSLPAFFGRAFHRDTLDQILFLRAQLDWRSDAVQCFIAALALGILHGDMGRNTPYLSNQLPRTISTKPDYSLRYWRERGLWARKRDAFATLEAKAAYRLSTGVPPGEGSVLLADARLTADLLPQLHGAVAAVVTSPPYLDVTSYEEDQWLRLWFLGGEPRPTARRLSPDDRHTSAIRYWRFLGDVWAGVAPLLRDGATVVCRIGSRRLAVPDVRAGVEMSLRSAFGSAEETRPCAVSALERRQTRSFRPGSHGCGYEVDLTYTVTP
jgi:hypothetical protein